MERSTKGFLTGTAKRILRSSDSYIVRESRFHRDAHLVTNIIKTLECDQKQGHLMSTTLKTFIIRRKVVSIFIGDIWNMFYVVHI